jgi:formate-dependent nitrite reductase membrane component NrfD
MFLKPAKSELSRGLWVISFFAILGFIQVAPVVVSALPWTGTGQILKIIMGIICILIIIHGFLTMSIVKALPVWNSSMMVPLAVISGLWVGSQVAVLLTDLLGQNINLAETWARWSLLGFIAFLGLFILGAAHSSTPAQVSIKRLLAGEWSVPFYIGVVAIGIVIPLIITVAVWGSDIRNMSSGILFIRCLCVVIGDLMARYGIMKNALCSPLI